MIKPYYQDDQYGITIYHGDCMDILPELPKVDLVLTDPPYNISNKNDNRDRSKYNSPIMRRESPLCYDFGEWDNMERDDFLSFTRDWLLKSCDLIREGGTIISFFNKEDISFLGWEAKNKNFRTRVIFTWCKSNPTPSFRKVNYLSSTEFIWIGSKGDTPWTFNFKTQKEMLNYFITSNSSGYGETEHPTEKPITLLIHLLEIHSNDNHSILDPFMGSGTTLVAAKQLNRKAIGIEIEEKYCEIAVKRLQQGVFQFD